MTDRGISPALTEALAQMSEISKRPLQRNIVLKGDYGFMVIVPTWSLTYERHLKRLGGKTEGRMY